MDKGFAQRFACATASAGMFLFGAHGAQAQTEKTLYSFCSARGCSDGAESDGIAFDPTSGNLFGVAAFGGNKHDCTNHTACNGVVYEFSPSTGTYTELYEFCKHLGCADGKNPINVKLVIDTAGNLYGTTEFNGPEYYLQGTTGGTVFELIHGNNGWREKVLYTFCSKSNCTDGSDVRAGLIYAGESTGQPYDGVSPLYGTTFLGGENNKGAVFSVAPKPGTNKWEEQVLYSFCSQTNCTDGFESDAALSLDANGDLFGTTTSGGQYKGGTVFELSPNGGTYTEAVLYGFCAQTNCADGEGPHGGVLLDSSGSLLGTTDEGGSSNDGVLFELTPNGSVWQYNELVNFDSSTGANSRGPLLSDGSGGVYGTTGGLNGSILPTLFHFNGTLQTLYTFCAQKGCHDGRFPFSNLVQDGSGNIFGTTQSGARRNSGTLFEVSP